MKRKLSAPCRFLRLLAWFRCKQADHPNLRIIRRGVWSIGCIGILSDWVVETAVTLCRAGETVLTLEALAKHALKPAQRLKLETEARTGEFKIEEAKKESERELQRLLGRSLTVPMSSLPHPPLSNGTTTSSLPPKSHASSHIERAAHHDPVGEQVVTGTSAKCSYLGVIEVTRRQFQEAAGTTCVECPTCGARRTLKSRHPIGHIFHRIRGA